MGIHWIGASSLHHYANRQTTRNTADHYRRSLARTDAYLSVQYVPTLRYLLQPPVSYTQNQIFSSSSHIPRWIQIEIHQAAALHNTMFRQHDEQLPGRV